MAEKEMKIQLQGMVKKIHILEESLHAMSRETDLNGLLEEARQMLSSVTEILASTMQQGIEVIKNYEELASNKVEAITKTKKKELAELLSAYGETIKSCTEKKEIDFRKVEDKLRKELADCYKKHYGSLDKILSEKASVHEEAEKIKNELQQAMLNCVSASNKTECFVAALNTLKEKLKLLSSRMGDILKKEALARVKASKAVYECDKKAMDEAYKKCTTIINDAKRCTAQQK